MSPIDIAVRYTAAALILLCVLRIGHSSAVLVLVATAAYVVATVALFAIITWVRDDDWLAAGVLFTLTVYLGGVIADVIVSVVITHSIGEAVVRGVALSFSLPLRALVGVPLMGGIIAVLRKLTSFSSKQLYAVKIRSSRPKAR